MRYRTTASALAIAFGAIANPALAQEVAAEERIVAVNEINDIVVTARKRSESLQDVPIAVTVVQTEALERRNITRLDQLGAVIPNATVKTGATIPTEVQPFIRSIGDRSSEPAQDLPVAISIDGVYLVNVAGSNVDVFDIEQVEVLRGPQGVLQGRNSPGGAINIRTKRPSGEFHGRASASYERFDSVQLKGYLEAPLIDDVLAAKISAFRINGGNYSENLLTGQKDSGGQEAWGGRVGLLFTPTLNLTAYLSADYLEDSSPLPAFRPANHVGTLPAPYPGAYVEPQPTVCARFNECTTYERFTNGLGVKGPNRSKNRSVSLNVDWKLGGATLSSVTGYRAINQLTNADVDATVSQIFDLQPRKVKIRAISQELRLASDTDSRFSWLVGGYLLRSRIDLVRTAVLGGPLVGQPAGTSVSSTQRRSPDTDSYALFGQLGYEITDKWDISVGGRQSWDKKMLSSTPSAVSGTGTFERDYKALTAEVTTRYHFTPDILGYLKFSQGYRAGGFNGGASNLAAVNSFEPEKVDSYEAGLKSSWLDRRLVMNLTAFHYDYRDLQILALDPAPGAGIVQRVVNVSGMDIDGVELESSFQVSDYFRLSGNLSYLHAEYRPQILNLGLGGVQMADQKRQYAPKWTGLLQADYTIPISDSSLVISGNVNYRSETLLNDVPTAVAIQPAYAMVDAEISYHAPDDRFVVSVFGQNLTDKYYRSYGEPAGGLLYYVIDGRPRTYGVRLTAQF